MKNTLMAVMFFFSILFTEMQQIKIQEDYDTRIFKVGQSIRYIEIIQAEYNKRASIIEKISAIITSYNSHFPVRTRLKLANEIYNMTIKYDNLDIDLICATITHESARSWDSTIVSHVGAMGLMQIMPATGKDLAKQEGIEWTNKKDILFNPITNIRLGSRYLSILIGKYGIDGGLAAYNGGERRVALWIKKRRNNKYLYRETQKYIPSVLHLYEEFGEISM